MHPYSQLSWFCMFDIYGSWWGSSSWQRLNFCNLQTLSMFYHCFCKTCGSFSVAQENVGAKICCNIALLRCLWAKKRLEGWSTLVINHGVTQLWLMLTTIDVTWPTTERFFLFSVKVRLTNCFTEMWNLKTNNFFPFEKLFSTLRSWWSSVHHLPC